MTTIRAAAIPNQLSEDEASSSISALLNPEEARDSRQQASKRQSLRIKSHEAPAKPKRKRITQEQFQALSELFEQTDTPNYELREKLALKLNMTNREVQVWFQNRRAKFNRARVQEQRNQQLLLQQQKQQQQHWQDESNANPLLIYSTPSYHHHQDHFYHDIQHRTTKRRWPEPELSSSSSLSYHEDSFSSTSSSSSSTPTSPYPALSPDMAPLEILAMAADYVQRCDQEQEEAEQAAKKRRIEEDHTPKSWRPWL
ncbi:homeobox domain-containing protein [Fennellomyces sp. T-0311]|nr:homeobox domain-containing protein [Fennellomyces sp. T-0311]